LRVVTAQQGPGPLAVERGLDGLADRTISGRLELILTDTRWFLITGWLSGATRRPPRGIAPKVDELPVGDRCVAHVELDRSGVIILNIEVMLSKNLGNDNGVAVVAIVQR